MGIICNSSNGSIRRVAIMVVIVERVLVVVVVWEISVIVVMVALEEWR